MKPSTATAMDTIVAPQPQSRLLSGIPGELRNRIMRFTTKPETDITVYRHSASGNPYHSLDIPGQALLLVCKQLRSEFTQIFWLESTVHLHEPNLTPKALNTLVDVAGPAASEMPRLHISHRVYTLAGSGHDDCDKIDIHLTKGQHGIECEGMPHTLRGGDEVLCVCKFQTLVPTKATGGVLDWAQEYVRILRTHKQAGGAPEDAFHCWICAGRVWWHECAS